MDIRLVLHLESATEDVVWWGESPDVAGFTVSDVHLDVVLATARQALSEILAADGQVLGELVTILAADEPLATNDASETAPSDAPRGPRMVTAIRELASSAR